MYTKKIVTRHNSRYIHGQFDLGVRVIKVADINARSIRALETNAEKIEELTETGGNEKLSPECIIQTEVFSDYGSHSQVQTVDTDNSMVTTLELLDEMVIDDNLQNKPNLSTDDTTQIDAVTAVEVS